MDLVWHIKGTDEFLNYCFRVKQIFSFVLGVVLVPGHYSELSQYFRAASVWFPGQIKILSGFHSIIRHVSNALVFELLKQICCGS